MNDDPTKDAVLVLAARKGSSRAFRALVERWQEPLWRHAYRLIGREDAAWDVLQEAWIAIADRLHKLDEPKRFRAWAFTIVRRRAFDRARDDERRRTSPLEESATEEREESSEVALLRRALSRLAESKRMLLDLHYVQRMELRDIASILGIPEGTVKSRLHQARLQLRAVIERIDHE